MIKKRRGCQVLSGNVAALQWRSDRILPFMLVVSSEFRRSEISCLVALDNVNDLGDSRKRLMIHHDNGPNRLT